VHERRAAAARAAAARAAAAQISSVYPDKRVTLVTSAPRLCAPMAAHATSDYLLRALTTAGVTVLDARARARAHTHTHARDALSSGMRMTHYTQAHFKSRRRSRPVDRAEEAGPPYQSLRRVSASLSRHSSSSHAPPRPRLVALQVACHVHRAA
jgi:hypothetical protein